MIELMEVAIMSSKFAIIDFDNFQLSFVSD